MPPRATIGLYNSYDPVRFHEQHRRTLARAAPLALAFDCNLATFGFPFDEGRRREMPGKPDLRTSSEIAEFVAASTTIGEGGAYFVELAAAGRFSPFPFPNAGFPPQLGAVVLATRRPERKRAITVPQAQALLRSRSTLLLFGLGPHGVPRAVFSLAKHHLDVTGREMSLETATALGAVVGALLGSARFEAGAEQAPRLTVDAIVPYEQGVVLVERANEPFQGRFALPGGFVEPGETTEAAVVREVSEETGLRTRVVRLVGVYSDPGRDPRGPTVTAAYELEVFGGRLAGGSDARRAKSFRLSSLPPLAFDHDRIVSEWLALHQS